MLPLAEDAPETVDDSHLTCMSWPSRSNLPLRFRDEVPQPPPPLPLAHSEPIPSTGTPPTPPPETQEPHQLGLSVAARIGSGLRRIFRTPHNVFGLFHHYEAAELPSFDPEEQTALQDLSDIPVRSEPEDPKAFYPYPNRSAFELGHWHWNGGAQKSQASFHELMGIICAPDFKPADVRDVNWDNINKELGTGDEGGEWLDEDAGWTRTPVTISVPYQSRRGIDSDPGAGPRNYTVGGFHHRCLVSVIKEKVSGLGEFHKFHFEPHELHWQPDPDKDPVRVQDELYTSPAFIKAHQELQDSPKGLGCDLPRVVAALMFWSDITHLTTFGNVKLWPLYMYFGNESKYRRCKPTCHLCEHVAYFQTVSFFLCSSLP